MGRTGRRAIGIAAQLCALAAAPAFASAPPGGPAVAAGDLPPTMPDGRMLGHLPYGEAAATDLILAPPGFAIGLPCLIHRDAAPDLTRMLAAAALAPGVGKSLRGVSCFRAIARQRAVFCRGARPGICVDPADRARSVGPPGYSEHATGYAIDFGARPSPGCLDVDSCLAQTPAGRWLIAHAPEFGFELSFPTGNAQGVTWEPWHWRWVGASDKTPGADQARLIFGWARASYAASPKVEDASDAELPVAPFPPIRPPAMLPPLEPGPVVRRRR